MLVDARHGVVEQTRRHSLLVSLLGVPHLVICVNKMDLVDYDPDRFEEIRAEFTEFAARLDLHDVTFIPISALDGDNVVDRSANMAWYEGPTLLHHLETVYTASDEQPHRRALPGAVRDPPADAPSTATTAATPARSPPARCGRATRWSCCRRG